MESMIQKTPCDIYPHDWSWCFVCLRDIFNPSLINLRNDTGLGIISQVNKRRVKHISQTQSTIPIKRISQGGF
jgi:hypothetical protein